MFANPPVGTAAFLAGAPEVAILNIFGSTNDPKKVEIEGVGPIWRDPHRKTDIDSRFGSAKRLDGVPIGDKKV